MRLRFWLFILVTGYLGTTLFAQTDTSLNYSFFVAGHTYGVPEDLGIHPPFREKFAYIRGRPEIKFGVLTGDIVAANPTATDWDAVDADIDSLGLPVYFTVGNHDAENLPLFENRYGSTYYHFSYENDLFIVLDPNLDSWNISGDQLDFLKEILMQQAGLSHNVFVFFHQILWRDSDSPFKYIIYNSGAGRGDSINFWTEVEPLFRGLTNEVFMFAGDLGAPWSSDVTYDHYENITLIATGMGDHERENFIVVNVNSDKTVSFDLICLSDTVSCLGNLTDYLKVDELVAIQTPVFSQVFEFIPNPAFDQIRLQADPGGCERSQIYNVWGVLTYEVVCADFHRGIDVTNWQRGMYVAIIYRDNRRYMSRFILQ
ncbi:MAG: metallophosphoesterase [Calditrichaeota bacterium]|nr:metallophosphoesterase [Calditrichota bacterium]